jgi:hypothetical protein
MHELISESGWWSGSSERVPAQQALGPAKKKKNPKNKKKTLIQHSLGIPSQSNNTRRRN